MKQQSKLTATIMLGALAGLSSFHILASDNDTPSPYIINGTQVDANRYPYMGLLYQSELDNPTNPSLSPFCGATLLDEQHVLTAAHCVYSLSGKDMANLEVVFKLNDMVNEIMYNPYRYAVTSVYYPDTYGQVEKEGYVINIIDDIAILKLVSPVSSDLTPVNRYPNDDVQEPTYRQNEQQFTLIGYGLTADKASQMSQVLNQVAVTYLDTQACIDDTGWDINEHQICATGTIENGQRSGVCNGDSGGPLLYEESGTLYQAGIVSFGSEVCGDPNYVMQAVYTEVADHETWINQVLAGQHQPKYNVNRISYTEGNSSNSSNSSDGGSLGGVMIALLAGLAWWRRRGIHQ